MSEESMTEDELEELTERRHREEVWEAIRQAFESRVRPPTPLTYQGWPVAEDVEETLSDKEWHTVTGLDLQRVRIDINSLTPDAFWYYFRSFAHHSLLMDEATDDPGGWMVSALTPPKKAHSERFVERIEALSPEERSAVSRFIHWYDGETNLVDRDRLFTLWPAQDL
ncbi:DUF6714 family protein [Streptomyces sp. NBC_01435]|uniref:DUF6714 family protein n=1 Tax=Streptomyces sp. NBC_01435 TaxID=2903865 RepID=UPI002E32A77A|nr:DUF6714 family protein [Streptomyces sp. NBC_01435]